MSAFKKTVLNYSVLPWFLCSFWAPLRHVVGSNENREDGSGGEIKRVEEEEKGWLHIVARLVRDFSS